MGFEAVQASSTNTPRSDWRAHHRRRWSAPSWTPHACGRPSWPSCQQSKSRAASQPRISTSPWQVSWATGRNSARGSRA